MRRLTKKLEAEILKLYHAYWDAYLKGDFKTFASYLDENTTVFGTAQGEVFTSKQEAVKFYKATADQMTGKADFRKRKISAKSVGDTVVINEESDLHALIDGVWTFYGHARITAIFEQKGNTWKLVHQHGSFPDGRTEAGEQIAVNKVKEENVKLKEAIKRRTIDLENKNRELEIETALEKVRSVAMGMKGRADMLKICKTISLQLASLGLKEIRNVQTAIFNVPAGTYMNYEYYAKHKKTFITETLYTNHKVARAFAAKMLKGKGEVSVTYIKGKEKVKEWLNYQKSTNVFIDTYLNKATSLTYYWFSLGPVALGISTYLPLSKEDLQLFQRFLKVFELAYRRYLDIEKAEAQAREAQIEAALERIRAASLAMQDSSALGGIIYKLYGELTKLDAKLDRCFIMIVNPDNRGITWWMAGQEGLLAENGFFVPMNQHPSHLMYLDYCKKRKKKWTYLFEGKEKRDWDRFGFTKTELAKLPEPIKAFMAAAKKVHLSGSSDQFGLLVTGSFEPLPEEQQEIINRFTIAFNQAYVRFLDLQKAEAQAREAEIQLALERVRARSLAMHKTDELQQVVNMVAQQLLQMGIDMDGGVFIAINDEVKKDLPIWAAAGAADYVQKVTIPFLDRQTFTRLHDAIIRRQPFYTEVYSKKDKNEFLNHLFRYHPWNQNSEQRKKELLAREGGYARSVVINQHTSIGITNHHGKKFTDAENEILRRFGSVLEQSYTRFLDLQKAEAQAKEAQIEAALERIRSKVTAMQESSELLDIVVSMRREFVALSHEAGYFWYMRWLPDKYEKAMTSGDGTRIGMVMTLPRHIHGDIKLVADWEKSDEAALVFPMDVDTAVDYVDKMITLGDFQQVDPQAPTLDDIRHIGGLTFIMARTTHGEIGYSLTGVVPNPPEEDVNTLVRFATVFDLAYRRFEDLKEAERRNRETQIELALEKVRSRTMAMHKSAELKEVIKVVLEQFVHLNINVKHAGFYIDYRANDDMHIWLADPNIEPFYATFPYFDTPTWNSFRDAKAKGKSFFTDKLDFEEKNKFYRFLFKFFEVPEDARKFYLECKGLAVSTVLLDNVGLYIENFDAVPYSDEENNILMRFGKVFQQTYTRFLDLQKAEAQAKEAQIEAALERVRSRTMAMQKSDELLEAGELLCSEMTRLGITSLTSGYVLMDADERIGWNYTPNPGTGKIMPAAVGISHVETAEMQRVLECWKNKTPFSIIEMEEEQTIRHQTFVAERSINFPLSAKELLAISPKKLVLHNFNFKEGYILIVGGEKLTDDQIEIMLRFTNVFQQTYTRFLDLQRAEAQAKEARIEAALEKVRSRTMAMQKSGDLNSAAADMFKEIQALGMHPWGCGFNIFDSDEKAVTQYMSLADGGISPPFRTPLTEDPFFIGIYNARQRKDELLVMESAGESLAETYRYMFGLPGSGEIFGDLENAGFEMPKYQITHCAYFSQGYLVFITYQQVTEAHDIFKRFAKVFDQTYTRFLDLQKAEAQARESQIEAALERVRSRSMAMHNSKELGEVAKVMFNQMKLLGGELFAFGIVLCDKDENVVEQWHGLGEGDMMTPFHVPVDLDYIHRYRYDQWKGGVELFSIEIPSDYIARHFELMFALPSVKMVMDDLKSKGIELAHPSWEIDYGASFRYGYLLVSSLQPYAEDKIFPRFAKVFEQAYTRFLDLQKAEAQARQAEIELALERVRAKVMAMTTTKDLDETSLVFGEQLRNLGIDWQFSYFWLVDEVADKNTFWITWPDNKTSITAYTMKEAELYFNECLVAWKAGIKVHDNVYTGTEVQPWLDTFQRIADEAGGVALQVMQASNFPEGIFYYDAMMKYGSFGVLYNRPATEEEKNIQVRFAIEFERTYTRFLDLQKAEAQAREAQIEAALEKVRSRSLAMQQPKELTEVAELLRKEMGQLGVEELETSSIYIVDKGNEQAECWYAIKDIREESKNLVSDEMTITFAGTWVGNEMDRFYRGKKEQISILMKGDKRKEWINYCAGKSKVLQGYYGDEIPERTYHLVKFNGGYMGAASPGDISAESWDLLRRAASVFSLAYTRFNDLKISEAHALQAEKDLIAIKEAKQKAEEALGELQATQKQLVQSEKMASLGELTAGIAHEIQNPLNFVNNFSEVSKELLDEMKEELEKGNVDDAKEIMNDVIQNLEKINHHGKRADGIVKGMLQHSRSSSGQKEWTDINALCDEYLRLAYHGLRAKDKSFNAKFETDLDASIGNINILPQDLGRVVLNLINNAFYAVSERLRQSQPGSHYEPTVTVSTKRTGNTVEISVRDNGTGIPQKVIDKIFQPFFTTKPTGQGTGLGLSLSYDIVTKGHGGELKVETKEGKGTEFIIQLPA